MRNFFFETTIMDKILQKQNKIQKQKNSQYISCI